MSEIEAEIRRQLLEERDRILRSQMPPASGGIAPPPPVPTGPPYHALPPPSFPQAGPSYPAQYVPSPASYPPHYPAQPSPQLSAPPAASGASKSAQRKGALGGLGAVGIALAKFWTVIKGLLIGLKFLSIGKYLLTAGSMLASIALYSALMGWRFAVGIVLLIFIHEAGHALALKRLGHEVKAMVFVPFLGAYVQYKALGNATESAQIAIMGPVAGMVAGMACGALYAMTNSPIWLVLAHFSFYINLFNLAAISWLDGGRVAALIPPRVLLGGLLVNLLINWRSPICWLLLMFALPLIAEQWRRNTIDPSLQVSKQDQWTYTAAYFGLVLFLGFTSLLTQDWIWQLRHIPSVY